MLAVMSGSDGLTPEALDLGLDALERLERIPGVIRVQSPAQVYRDLFGAEDPESLARAMQATPFYRDLLVSQDGSATAVLVHVAPEGAADARAGIVAGVRAALAPYERLGFTVHLVGSTVLSVALDRVSADEARNAFPLAVLGSLVMLAVLLRSARATAVAAACAALALVLTFGLMAATGLSLNMVTAALPALLWVLCLGNIVHLVRRYRVLAARRDRQKALADALRQTQRGCVLAAVTTASGFASLLAAPMDPVRELGAFAAAGVLVSLAVNLTLGPVLLDLLRVAGDRRADHEGVPPAPPLAVRRPGPVVLTAALLAASAATLLPRIAISSNPIAFLPPEHPVSRDYRAVAGTIGGFYTLEIVLDLPCPWTEPEALAEIESVAENLRRSEVVSRVVSPVDVLRQLSAWDHGLEPAAYAVPRTRAEAERLLAGLDEEESGQLASLVADERTVRVSAIVDEMEEQRFLELADRADARLSQLPEGWSGTSTGQVLQLVRSQQRLVTTQLRSLAVALLLVFVTMRAGLGSWRLTALSVPPNVLPLLAAFALMSLLRLPLDPGTVMVASVALGIAVDNTAHALEAVRRLRAAGHAKDEAVALALRRVAPAMAITAATAAVGFLALLTSDFVPIAHFGLLAAAAMAVALAGDALLLPASLTLGRRS